MSEKQEEKKQVEQEETGVPNLPTLLKGIEGAPSETDIEKWKQKYGEVFVSGFSETEIFVWRPLNRLEHSELQKRMRQAAQQQIEEFTDLDFEESVVNTCILWGSSMGSLKTKGGSYTTLSEQIMLNSNFMDSSTAAVLVAKL